MSIDSPAKQNRLERHLMRQRGAGVRSVTSSFGFSFVFSGAGAVRPPDLEDVKSAAAAASVQTAARKEEEEEEQAALAMKRREVASLPRLRPQLEVIGEAAEFGEMEGEGEKCGGRTVDTKCHKKKINGKRKKDCALGGEREERLSVVTDLRKAKAKKIKRETLGSIYLGPRENEGASARPKRRAAVRAALKVTEGFEEEAGPIDQKRRDDKKTVRGVQTCVATVNAKAEVGSNVRENDSATAIVVATEREQDMPQGSSARKPKAKIKGNPAEGARRDTIDDANAPGQRETTIGVKKKTRMKVTQKVVSLNLDLPSTLGGSALGADGSTPEIELIETANYKQTGGSESLDEHTAPRGAAPAPRIPRSASQLQQVADERLIQHTGQGKRVSRKRAAPKDAPLPERSPLKETHVNLSTSRTTRAASPREGGDGVGLAMHHPHKAPQPMAIAKRRRPNPAAADLILHTASTNSICSSNATIHGGNSVEHSASSAEHAAVPGGHPRRVRPGRDAACLPVTASNTAHTFCADGRGDEDNHRRTRGTDLARASGVSPPTQTLVRPLSITAATASKSIPHHPCPVRAPSCSQLAGPALLGTALPHASTTGRPNGRQDDDQGAEDVDADEDVDWLFDRADSPPARLRGQHRADAKATGSRHSRRVQGTKSARKAPELDLDDLLSNIATLAQAEPQDVNVLWASPARKKTRTKTKAVLTR